MLAEKQKYEVALSFSGDKRDIVRTISNDLKENGIRHFYDFDEQDKLIGRNLEKELQFIYSNSYFIVIILSSSYINDNNKWTQYELKIIKDIIKKRKNQNSLIIINIDDVDTKKIGLEKLAYYDFKKHFNNHPAMVSGAITKQVGEIRRYIKNIEKDVESLSVDGDLVINEVEYGEGSQIYNIKEDFLMYLDSKTKLPKSLNTSEEYYLKYFFENPNKSAIFNNKKLCFPRVITVKGKRSKKNSVIAVYICTDIFYLQNYEYSLEDDCFEISCYLGRGGIAELVHNPFSLDIGFGAVGAIVAVEFENMVPLHRSKYILSVRKGIRYPDDIWWSKKTGKPIISSSGNRFIFQSKQPNGNSTDIFVADFNGDNIYNLTYKKETAYDGFFDDGGNEVAIWVNKNTIQYCSMDKGIKKIKKKLIPVR